MTHRKIIAAAALAAGMTVPAAFGAPEDAARIAQLEAKLAKLEAQQMKVDGALAQSRAVDAAVVDAEGRARFLQSGFTTGWDNGFQIGSNDGLYTLRPYLEFQFRNVNNYTDGGNSIFEGDTEGDEWENGFEIRRLRVGFKGNLFNPDFSYNFRINNGGSFDLAYGDYKFADEMTLRFGQFKLNWAHEETVSGTKQLAADRSLFNQFLGGGNTRFVQGVAVLYGSAENPLRAEVAFTDGDNTANTDYTDQQGTSNYQNFGVAARVEYKLSGDWKDYADFTALGNTEDLLVIGGGVDWAQGGDGDVYRFTVDAQWENSSGLGAYAAVIYNIADGDVSNTFSVGLDDSYGGLVQVGYLLPDAQEWEVFGRASYIHFDDEINGEDDYYEITAGVNRYYYGHNAKLTIDAGWLPRGSPFSSSALDVKAGDEDQFIVRAQMQIVL